MRQSPFRRDEQGKGNLQFLLTLLGIVTIGYFVVLNIPFYVQKVQMTQNAMTIIRDACVTDVSAREIRQRLEEQAQHLKLPSGTKIEVDRQGRLVNASVSYVQEIKLPFYVYPWTVNISVQESSF
jgi:hypothetical protein